MSARKTSPRPKPDPVLVDSALRCAGQLATAAAAILGAHDDAFGRLRIALMHYDNAMTALARSKRSRAER
jgi:hypothetical protein